MENSYTLKAFLAGAAALGFNTELFRSRPQMHRDSRDVWHVDDSCKEVARTFFGRRSRQGFPDEMAVAALCSRCSQPNRIFQHPLTNTYEALKELVERQATWDRLRADDSDPVAAVTELKLLQGGLVAPARWLRQQELVDTGSLMRARMSRRIEHLETLLRSEATQLRLVELCTPTGMERSSLRTLVALPELLPAADFNDHSSDLLEAIVAAWAAPLSRGPHLLELPRDVALTAYHAAPSYQQRNRMAKHGLGMADLLPSDDAAIVETAAALWEPSSEGPLADLGAALQTARAAVAE